LTANPEAGREKAGVVKAAFPKARSPASLCWGSIHTAAPGVPDAVSRKTWPTWGRNRGCGMRNTPRGANGRPLPKGRDQPARSAGSPEGGPSQSSLSRRGPWQHASGEPTLPRKRAVAGKSIGEVDAPNQLKSSVAVTTDGTLHLKAPAATPDGEGSNQRAQGWRKKALREHHSAGNGAKHAGRERMSSLGFIKSKGSSCARLGYAHHKPRRTKSSAMLCCGKQTQE
jgi:hypothetical protein